MHDVAQAYYDNASKKIDEHRNAIQELNEQLVVDLLAFKVSFDAQWTQRMRDFRGESAVQAPLPVVLPIISTGKPLTSGVIYGSNGEERRDPGD